MPRPDQGRVMWSLRVKRSALDEVDVVAAVEGVDRSEAGRRLLSLGLQAWHRARRESRERG